MAKAKSDETHQLRLGNKFSAKASLNVRASNSLTSIPKPHATSLASLSTRALNAEILACFTLAGVKSSSCLVSRYAVKDTFSRSTLRTVEYFLHLPSVEVDTESVSPFSFFSFLFRFSVWDPPLDWVVSQKHNWCHTFPTYSVNQWVIG